MELLTVKETAAMLKVSPLTVRRYIAAGRLGVVRIGRTVRVRRDAIEQLSTPITRTGTDGAEPSVPLGTPTSDDDPFWDIVGIGDAPDVADMSSDKYRYLAEVAADNHR